MSRGLNTMKLKIKEDAAAIFTQNHHLQYKHGGGMSPEARKFQFNTAPIEGVSENGLRILDFKGEESIIEEIIDDVRPSRLKCPECFTYLREDDKENEPCWWCGK
jgi:hypothetical protein